MNGNFFLMRENYAVHASHPKEKRCCKKMAVEEGGNLNWQIPF
jgi:hypothetical protein